MDRKKSDSKVWFITGASRGFGREFAVAALDRGDRVAATARNPRALDDLVTQYGDDVLPLPLDVTDRQAAFAAIEATADHFGRLDVVVNNAGYGLFGAVEELDPEALRKQFETNVIGVLHIVQAALPILRAQGGGHIIQVSSTGGIGAFPTLGGYNASKWALEALSESLAQEVTGTGIDVTLVEPSGFATEWGGPSAVLSHELPYYEAVRAQMDEYHRTAKPGDPTAAAQAVLEIADADHPPLRVLFGEGMVEFVEQMYADRLEGWRRWRDLSERSAGASRDPQSDVRSADPVAVSHQDEVNELEREWFRISAAMESNDAETLKALLADSFTLGHMSGHRQSRDDWMNDIETGQAKYHSVHTEAITIDQSDPGAPIVTARTTADVTIAGERGTWPTAFRVVFERRLHNVWRAVSADGSAW